MNKRGWKRGNRESERVKENVGKVNKTREKKHFVSGKKLLTEFMYNVNALLKILL